MSDPDGLRRLAEQIGEALLLQDYIRYDPVPVIERVLRFADSPVAALTARCRELEAERDDARKDAAYHFDCRPNRRQAEAALELAKSTNDKWADEVAKNRELAARCATLEAELKVNGR